MRLLMSGLAMGSIMLVGSIAPTHAQDATTPQIPVEFNGRITCGPPVSADRAGAEATLEVGGEGMTVTRNRNGAWRQTATVTDPRLEGSWYHTWESDSYRMPETEAGASVAAATWRVENDDGAWEGGHMELTLADGTAAPTLSVLVGEGAYEGLTVLMNVQVLDGGCAADIHGIIFQDAPTPVPYVPE